MSQQRATFLLISALAILTLAILGSFAYAIRLANESRAADRQFAMENRERIRSSELRFNRACEARGLVARELLRLSHDPALIDELNALNDKYPQIQPCVIQP